jgi:hypothetical protein
MKAVHPLWLSEASEPSKKRLRDPTEDVVPHRMSIASARASGRNLRETSLHDNLAKGHLLPNMRLRLEGEDWISDDEENNAT